MTVAFEGLSLGDLKPHESELERRKHAALARDEPRKSPQRPSVECEPLVLKPHLSKIAQRKMDAALMEKYMTASEKEKVRAEEQSLSDDVSHDNSETADTTMQSPIEDEYAPAQWQETVQDEETLEQNGEKEEEGVVEQQEACVEHDPGAGEEMTEQTENEEGKSESKVL